MDYVNWHSIWEFDYLDEQRYYDGTLVTPQGSERLCARVGDGVLFVGDSVIHTPSGRHGVIERIVYWHRISKRGNEIEYYQVDYLTNEGGYWNDTAENFVINGAAFPQSDMEIPF